MYNVINMTIQLSAKCSDMCSMRLYGDDAKMLGEMDGYVPDFMPGEHYGDYVILDIDVDTGRILNWNKPTNANLNKTFSIEL